MYGVHRTCAETAAVSCGTSHASAVVVAVVVVAIVVVVVVVVVVIIIDNFCIALFTCVPKLTALYILQHFLSFTNIIHIIMTTNDV